jgi:hypothetical protein
VSDKFAFACENRVFDAIWNIFLNFIGDVLSEIFKFEVFKIDFRAHILEYFFQKKYFCIFFVISPSNKIK